MSEPSFESLLSPLPLKAALLTDAEGVVLIRAGGASEDDLGLVELQRMAVTYAQTAETASKLKLGKSTTSTAFYEKGTVVHVSVAPLVLTLLADADANVGLLLDAAPALAAACEPMRAAQEQQGVRATFS